MTRRYHGGPSAWQIANSARFDPDGPDLRLGDCDGSWPPIRCVHCGVEIEYSGECDECRAAADE